MLVAVVRVAEAVVEEEKEAEWLKAEVRAQAEVALAVLWAGTEVAELMEEGTQAAAVAMEKEGMMAVGEASVAELEEWQKGKMVAAAVTTQVAMKEVHAV